MSRRLTTFVLAAFYLLQATWLLHAGMDLFLLPTVRTAAADSSDGCCASACGCPDEVKLANGCCCNKSLPVPAAPKKSAPRSALEEARCKGVQDAMTQAFTQPVTSAFATLPTPDVQTRIAFFLNPQPFFTPPAASIEKVPIA